MDKLRNIKNRLSISVDKLSPSRRSKSQQRKSMPLGDAPLSEGNIPSSVRTSRADDRPTSAFEVTNSSMDTTAGSSRPSSYCETDHDITMGSEEWLPSGGEETPVNQTFDDVEPTIVETLPASADLASDMPLKRPTPSMVEGESLISEVMKEVEKITDISDSVTTKRQKLDGGLNETTSTTNEKPIPGLFLGGRENELTEGKIDTSEEQLAAMSGAQSQVGEEKIDTKIVDSTRTTLSATSTCRAESLTSGYLSDSDMTLSDGGHPRGFLSLTSEYTQSSVLSTVTSQDLTKSAFTTIISEESDVISPVGGQEEPSSSSTGPTPSAFTSVAPHKSGDGEAPREADPITKPPTEPKPVKLSKKESIYSRIMKRKDPAKEPIYAKIKPKLNIETSFQPIEPNVGKNAWQGGGVVKPEPIYSSVKARAPGGPLVPAGPMSAPTSPMSSISAPFAPVGTGSPGVSNKVEPIYSKVKPREARSSTLPRDQFFGITSNTTGTLPKDSIYSRGKSKEPIYTKPLPLTPKEEEEARKRESLYSQGSVAPDYGKVTVRVGEISPSLPSRPAVITINNPGYAAPTGISPPVTNTDPPSSPPRLRMEKNKASPSPKPPAKSVSMSPTTQVKLINKTMECPSHSQPKVASDSSLVESSDTESTGRARLSNLVEELAQELEAVSRRLGSNMDDDQSKKEVLAKLLSTYDVPKNLRRVEEADESLALEAEQALVPTSISMDELRYVDDNEDNAETVYADVPDYSQDEFVIALDDENDPRYASLTRAMRQGKSSESPGRVSKRTAAVYTNAINVVTALKVLINSKSSRAATVLNKMGSLARPYATKVQGNVSDTTWIQRVIYHKSGHNGFDELRRYIKSGGEFCKELAVIMHERAELEASYAKGLHKLSGKLAKASKEGLGSVTQAWQMVAADLDQQGDIHRSVASSLADDVVRPLRQLIETQHKIRKGVESMVDKTTKNLHDWRAAENKSKKQCHNNCRDNEKIQDMMLEARLGRGKTLTDKETVKVEKQRRKAEEAVQKSDLEYYTCCVRAERARLEWESAVYKGSSCFQTLEEERLQSLRELVSKYHKVATEAAPKMIAAAAQLEEPVQACDVEKDIQAVISAKGTGENVPEQMLPDFYAEDMNNIMNRDRRREALDKFVQMLRTDLERERRGKQGVENLAKALQETPTFGGEESQQDVNDKLQHDAYNRLQHMKAMLAYLEAARYKVQSSLDELSNRPKMTHPLAKHIEVHRDKQGLTCSVLKVPTWVRGNSVDVSPVSGSPAGSPNWNDRGTADGNSVQPDSDFVSSNNFPHQDLNNEPPDSRQSTLSRILDGPLPQSSSPTPATNTNTTSGSPVETTITAPPRSSHRLSKVPPPPRVFMSAPRYPSLVVVADEFSSQGSDREYQNAMTQDTTDSVAKDGVYYAHPLPSATTVGRCKALYDYEANMYDELTIRTGDIINIHEKQPDGWWVGELDSTVGIFPATYVEEID